MSVSPVRSRHVLSTSSIPALRREPPGPGSAPSRGATAEIASMSTRMLREAAGIVLSAAKCSPEPMRVWKISR